MENLLESLYRNRVAGSLLRGISRRVGENVYEREWDILLIVDAASYDIMNEISDQYEYIESVESLQSRGSKSSEWAHNTFIHDYDRYEDRIRITNYVTANILCSLVLAGVPEKNFYRNDTRSANVTTEEIQMVKNPSDNTVASQLQSFSPIWLHQFSDDISYAPTDMISDQCLKKADSMNKDELVVGHYMQPHVPFISSEEVKQWPNNSNERMINMNESIYNSLIQAYTDNHHYILRKLRAFMSEVDNELTVAISSDHGNMYGRFLGIPYALGHPQYITFSERLRTVPYIEVDQSVVREDMEVETQVETEDETVGSDEVEDRLEALGYK